LKLIAPERRTMIAMKFTIELDIGLSFLLQAALPQLVTDRETKLIVVGGPSDRTAIADAALRSRKRNPHRRRGLVMDRTAGERKSNSRKTRPEIVNGTRPIYGQLRAPVTGASHILGTETPVLTGSAVWRSHSLGFAGVRRWDSGDALW
jgi:hypothetical protein